MKVLIYEARQRKNMSLRTLSEKTGISKTTLNNIENQTVSPTLEQLKLIAVTLDTKITALFTDKYK